MTLITENKIKVPTPPDSFRPTAQLKEMADSSNVIIPVPSLAARDALTPKAGLTVSRQDLPGGPLQIYDGTAWKHQGRNFKTLFANAGMTNQTGTGSRLLADMASDPAPYDRIMTANARLSITPAAIASGVSTIYAAVSLMQSSVGTSQGLSPLSWVSPGGYIQGTYVTSGEILVPANVSPLARLWAYVVSGSISTTASADAKLTQFWTEEYPA